MKSTWYPSYGFIHWMGGDAGGRPQRQFCVYIPHGTFNFSAESRVEAKASSGSEFLEWNPVAAMLLSNLRKLISSLNQFLPPWMEMLVVPADG